MAIDGSKLPDPKPRHGRKLKPKPDPALLPAPQLPIAIREEEDEEAIAQSARELITAYQADRLRALLAERARRSIESLTLYQPLPVQQAFHDSRAKTRLLRGSNRGGKTLPAAVEVARAVCGIDPKFPQRDGRCFVIGKDLDHIGQVMWRKLGRAGAFKIIRDQVTGRWRAFRPWDPDDLARAEESRLAPPLIPQRLIESIAWENKKESIPNCVKLRNGWELVFYSSLGKPPQGSDIDLWWFDEEIVDEDWLPEMNARTLDRKGKGIWSATPQAGTEQLYGLHERAEAELEAGLVRPAVQEFLVLLEANPHITDEDKREFWLSLSEEERQVRIQGEFALITYKVYPEFSMLIHGMEYQQVSKEWTRYVVIDPGFQVCAVLFAAVPPPQVGDFVVLYDELYLRECNAAKFGSAMAQKASGQTFEVFVIDYHMGLHSELGTGRTVIQQYSDALRERHVESRRTKCNFLPGSDDVPAGLLAVHAWLRVRDDGTPKLRVLRDSMKNLEYEFKRYVNKRVSGVITDEPNQRRNNHLMDTLRYLAMFNPKWVKPGKGNVVVGGAVRAFREKQKRRKEQEGGSYVRLGPGKK